MVRDLLRVEHMWVRLRLAGWALTALIPVRDILVQLGLVEPWPRLVLNVLSLAGLAVVAIGFERVVETAHERTGAH